MNFTREPIVVTVISAKEGYKLVLRNSKASGQEEFFVEAVEVISFGSHCFYRSQEKPKCFLLPVNDYEIFEVRETRMLLKMPGVERGGIKIGGGRESILRGGPREGKEEAPSVEVPVEEAKVEKRRERRRFRKRRERATETSEAEVQEDHEEVRKPSLIPPPNHLIRETMAHYKEAILPSEELIQEEEEKDFPLVEEEYFSPEEEESNNGEEVPF